MQKIKLLWRLFMKKKFVSTILIISILSTGLLSGCGKSASAESVDLTSVSLDTIKEKAKEEGTMGALVNTNNVSEPITSWEDLKNSDAKITLGDVLRGASSQMAVLSCAYAMGGDAENLDPAFDYFKELASEGRIDVGDGSVERLNRGEIDVLVTWDYLTLQYRDIVAANNPDLNMECHVMQDGAVQSGYCLVINKYAPHPYSAALTVEYLLSDEGQIERAKGYARPIRDDVVLPDDLKAKMISDDEYTNTIPLTDNDTVTKACSEIANRWEEEIIPLIGE